MVPIPHFWLSEQSCIKMKENGIDAYAIHLTGRAMLYQNDGK